MRFRLLSAVLLFTTAHSNTLQAAIVAQWNFNSAAPDGDAATGAVDASVGTGTALLTSYTLRKWTAGSLSDPAAADNSALQV